MVYSAGILVYRYTTGHLEVMLAHPGGPFWAKKDDASWSIPKGIIEDGESTQEAARREFNEETGVTIDGNLLELGSIKQSGQKTITAFAVCKDIDASKFKAIHLRWNGLRNLGRCKCFQKMIRRNGFRFKKLKRKYLRGSSDF